MNKATVAVLVGMASGGAGWSVADEVTDLSAARWRFRGPTARVEDKLGRQGLFLKQTFAYLGDVAFADGSLEVDLAVPLERTFVGVMFRVASEGNQERIYLRPHKSGLDDALQYEANFEGSSTWQLYSAPVYMRRAEILKEQWFHLKVVYSGAQASVFLGGSEIPTMVVPDLKRGYARGGIGLWAGPGGAWFSNVRFQADTSSPAAVAPGASVPLPTGMVPAWELSEVFDAAGGLPESLPAIANWQRVPVEPPGMLVIDRHRKSSGSLPPSVNFQKRLATPKGRKLVYARAVVVSDREQLKRMSFGYSDEVCVFVNGRIVFTGRSPWRFRDPDFMGIMDVENDAAYLPLRKGRNEVVMAVAEYFGGWGLIARFDDPAGLTLPVP